MLDSVLRNKEINGMNDARKRSFFFFCDLGYGLK